VVTLSKHFPSSQKVFGRELALQARKETCFDHAVEQIINTNKYANVFIKHQLERDQHPFIMQGASICMHGSAPDFRKQKKSRDRLIGIFGTDQYIHIKHGLGNTSYDLGDFMRKL
jgi:hypothetical protein